MPLLGRNRAASPEDGIRAFWDWWKEARGRLEGAIESRALEPLVGEISDRVKAIDPRLAWELGPGLKARHAFTLSSEGNSEIRPLAQRWLAAAPEPDATWEYHPARLPDTGFDLQIEGRTLARHDYRLALHVDDNRRRVDVEVFHPGHAAMIEEQRLMSMFLFLDHLLGEDDVERWLGQIQLAAAEPAASERAESLLEEVEKLRAMPTDSAFTVMQGVDAKGQPTFATVNLAIKRIDHLFADLHGAISVRLTSGWPPSPAEFERLDAAEDDLLARIEEAAIWIGRVTKPGSRVIHLVAEDRAAAEKAVEAWRKNNPDVPATAVWRSDPKWTFRSEWGG